MTDTTLFHPRTVPVSTNNVQELLASAMINRLRGYEKGAHRLERLARSYPDYTERMFNNYLLGLAMRQLRCNEDLPAATATLRRCLTPLMRDTPAGIAYVALSLAVIYYELGDAATGTIHYAWAILNLQAL